MTDAKPIVLFDGLCHMCSFSVQFLAARERENRLFYASMQSQTGQKILAYHNMPKDDYDSFLFIENGKLYAKSAAALRLFVYMKEPWPLLRVARFLPQGLRDWVYDRIARNRYALFGKRQSCMVPRADLAERFLP